MFIPSFYLTFFSSKYIVVVRLLLSLFIRVSDWCPGLSLASRLGCPGLSLASRLGGAVDGDLLEPVDDPGGLDALAAGRAEVVAVLGTEKY